jgi:ATP-binding cassette subfamily F protein 3
VCHGEVLGIVGDNGAGKTTLLDLLAGLTVPTSGTVKRPARARSGYFGQEIEELPQSMTVLSAAAERAPGKTEGELRDHLALFMFFGDDVESPVGTLSGGERRRLSLARLLLSGFDYLCMDEPTNHLDISTREGLESALGDFPGGVAVVSHDREFLARVADRILHVSGGRGRLYEGGFAEFSAARAEEKLRLEAVARAGRADRRQERVEAQPQKPNTQPGRVRNPMELAKLEARIIEKEDEQRLVRETMGLPESWKDPIKMRDLKQREQELASELVELNRRWENWQ